MKSHQTAVRARAASPRSRSRSRRRRSCRDLARAQGAHARNLVVLYLSGGNDALSMLVPYNDPFYYSRRPTMAIPPASVLQIGTDSRGVALGLHPRLTGLQADLRSRPARADSAHRLRELEPLAFPRHRHLVDRRSGQLQRARLARPLSRLAAVAGRSAGRLEHDAATCRTCCSRDYVAVPAIPSPAAYAFSSPNTGAEAAARTRRPRCASRRTCRSIGPQLAFVYGSAQAALATLDRVATVGAATRHGARVSEQRLRAGAAGGGRRDGARHRHAGVLGARPAASTRTRRRTSTRPTARTTT